MSGVLVIRGSPYIVWSYDTLGNALTNFDLPSGSTEGVDADTLQTQYAAGDGTVYLGVLPAAGAPPKIKKVHPITGAVQSSVTLTGIDSFTNRYSLAQNIAGEFIATTSIGATATLKRFSAAGATSQTYGVPQTDLLCLGLSVDRTVAYYSVTADNILRRWDLIADVALPPFAEMTFGGVLSGWTKNFIVLPDNGVIALYAITAIRVASNGARLTTYTPINGNSLPPVGAAYDPGTQTVFLSLSPFGSVAGGISAFGLASGVQIWTVDVPILRTNVVSRMTLTPIFGGSRAYAVGATTTEPIRRLRQPPTLQHDRFRTFYDRFQLDFAAGGALSDGTAVAQIALSFSDDGGHTWSQPDWISAGGLGEYNKQVFWSRLGSAITRIWRVEMTSAVPVAWLNVFLDLTPGAQ